jgi:hypothetical protein
MKSIYYFYILSIWLSVPLVSCDKDHQVPNEEELITTVIYTLTPQDGGEPVLFSFRDLDGDGGQDPIVILGRPKPNTIYHGVIELRNESVTPATDITMEVAGESLEHQFFYTFSDVNASYVYADVDPENNPIGISTTVVTGEASEGLLTIMLRHLPDKYASGVNQGDPANAGGETDIEVSFLLIIE